MNAPFSRIFGRFILGTLLLLVSLMGLACSGADNSNNTLPPQRPPRLVPRFDDHQLRVGMAERDITPEITDTFIDKNKDSRYGDFLPFVDKDCDRRWDLDEDLAYTDANGNGEYDRGEPLADPKTSGDPRVKIGKEPFHDLDKDGEFDAFWLFGGGRPASEVLDPMMGIATVLSYDEEYVVLVNLDMIGILGGHTRKMAETLALEGFDPKRLVVSATHDHSSVDGLGISGENLTKSGSDPAYMEWLNDRVVALVKDAVSSLEPAELWAGSIRVRDWDPWSTSVVFGGANPIPEKQMGYSRDIRDPIVVDDTISVIQYRHPANGDVIGTYVNWSGHPEVAWTENNSITADYPYYLRRRVRELYGGIAQFAIADCGGMQSMLGGWIPAYNENGQREMEAAPGGGKQPRLLTDSGWEFARANGYLLADAVGDVVEAVRAPADVTGLRVQCREVQLPVDNPIFYAGVMARVIDAPMEMMGAKEDCGGKYACGPARLWMITLDPAIQIATAPGEFLPELFVGLPTKKEAPDFNDPRPNRWFPQHNADLPLTQHADPFDMPPAVRDSMSGDILNFMIGLSESEFGYIVPEADYAFPGLADDFDHYEETLSPGQRAGTVINSALRDMATDPKADRLPPD